MRIRTLIATSVLAFPLAAVAEGDSPSENCPGMGSQGESDSAKAADGRADMATSAVVTRRIRMGIVIQV